MRLCALFLAFIVSIFLPLVGGSFPRVHAQATLQQVGPKFVDGGSVPKSQTPTFDWTAVSGATSYTVEICKVAYSPTGVCASLAIPVASLIPTNSYTPSVELPRNVTLYWRVRATATGITAGPWSSIGNFLSANAPPRPVSVVLSATVPQTLLTPKLAWSTTVPQTAVRPDTYEIQIATNSLFTQGVINQTTVGDTETGSTATLFKRSWTVSPALQNGTQYYWRIRSKTGAVTSGWTAASPFKTNVKKSGNVSPSANATLTTTTPTFSWQAVPSALTYVVQVSTNGGTTYTALSAAIPAATTSYTPTVAVPKPVAPQTRLYWRVLTNGIAGFGTSTSDAFSFTPASPPPLPVVVALSATVPQTTLTPKLAWNTTIPAGGIAPQSFDLEVCTDAKCVAGSAVATQNTGGVTETGSTATLYKRSWVVSPALKPSTTYYWRVRSKAPDGDVSLWTTPSTFKTFVSVSPPVLTALSATVPQVTLTPKLLWSTTVAAGTTAPGSYEVQIANDTAFTQEVINTTIIGTTETGSTATLLKRSWTVSPTLEHGTQYYWRVRGKISNGTTSAWSVTSPFKTVVEKATNTTPTNGSSLTTTAPTFTWNGVQNALSYVVQISTNGGSTYTALSAAIPAATTSYTPTVALPKPVAPQTRLYWRVLTNGITGFSSTAAPATSNPFTMTPVIAPSVPVLNLPATNSQQTTLAPTLKWTTAVPATAIVPANWDLQVATTNTFASPVINRTSVPVTVLTSTATSYVRSWTVSPNLAPGVTHYWRVRSKASDGDASAWSAVFSFKTPLVDAPDTGAPTVIVSLNASDTAVDTNQPVTITPSVTGTATGAITYEYRCKATDAYGAATSNASSTCTYPAAGSYVAGVRATRQGTSGLASSNTIVVTVPPPIPPTSPTPGTGIFPAGPLPPASAKKLNVLDLRYYAGGTSQEATYRSYHDGAMTNVANMVQQSTRYNGYSNPSALPLVDVVVKQTVKRYKTFPSSLSQALSDTSDGNNLCTIITNNNIDQIWIWLAQGDTGAYINLDSSVHYKDSSNYICNGVRSVSVINHAYNHDTNYPVRNPGDIDLHNYGHFMETRLQEMQGDELFNTHYTGVRYHFGNIVPGESSPWSHDKLCGNTHWAPNSSEGYVIWSPNTVPASNCLDWKPWYGGTKTALSCTQMGSCNDGRYYYVWWMQNMPSASPAITFDPDQSGPLAAKTIPPWVEFMTDIDAAMEYYGGRSDTFWMNTDFLNTLNPDYTVPYYIDNQTTTKKDSGGSLSWAHTSSGTNRLLVVTVAYGSDVGTPPAGYIAAGGVKCNGTALTKARSDYHNKNVDIWYMKAQPDTCTITVDFTGTNYDSIGVASSFTGVNQTTPVSSSTGGGNNGSPGGSYDGTITLTTAAGDVAFGAVASYTDSNGITPLNNTIEAFNNRNGGTVLFIGTKSAVGSSTPINWNFSTQWFWAATGITINL
jgi:hypothetical protein